MFKRVKHKNYTEFTSTFISLETSLDVNLYPQSFCCTITRVEVLSIGTDNKCVDSRYAITEGIQSMHVIQLSYIYAILNEDN
ncbi:hypothetical protein BLOT_016168 [Blomia tropicalis]|nr:hypothetical protein BLOT_016168 [Blomia tropicalis]